MSLRAVLVALVVALMAPAVRGSDGNEYAALVLRAQRGDAPGAVEGLSAWPAERAAVVASSYEGPSRTAASLLHTEVAVVSLDIGDMSALGAHLHAATMLGQTPSDFERRRNLALGYRYAELGHLRAAYGLYEHLLRRYVEDPDTLVAMGSIPELVDAMPKNWEVGIAEVGQGATRGWSLLAAERHYRRALAIRADYAEARLRLGRVLCRRGQIEQGRAELERVLEDRPSAEIVGYAHLFLGELAEARGQRADSIGHYRLAIQAAPHLQSARLALGEALYRTGHLRDAGDNVLDGLRAAPRDGAHGWYDYHTTSLHGYRSMMDALWSEAQK
jgi:tetratricopeptide (TPR) repeat protein